MKQGKQGDGSGNKGTVRAFRTEMKGCFPLLHLKYPNNFSAHE